MEEKLIKAIEIFKKETEKECYKVQIVDEEAGILDDKIGGLPYLPVSEEYPKGKDGKELALLLQVNLKNIDLEGYPKKGILEIFVNRELNYPLEYIVKYFEEEKEYQTNLPNIDLSNFVVNKPYKISLTKDKCYMPINDYRFYDTFIKIVNKLYNANLQKAIELDDFFGNRFWYDKLIECCQNPAITIGGYADFTQNDPRDNMKENKDECLFKLDSWDNYNKFHIGDSGILFAIISKEDIENSKFENALVDFDCC